MPSDDDTIRPVAPAAPNLPPTAPPQPAATAQPATETGTLEQIAVVLTDVRVVRVGYHTYHVPAGQVIRILDIPRGTSFQDGFDTKNVPAGDLKLGDHVGENPNA